MPTTTNSRRYEAAQGALIGLALLLVGVALALDGITVPRSPLAGGFLALGGVLYLVSAVLRGRARR